MMTKQQRVNILWLDDHLVPRTQPTRRHLQPWLRWLKTGNREKRFSLIEAQNLAIFQNELENRYAANISDSSYIHALMIDSMLDDAQSQSPTFESFNFPQARVIDLDAGAQLLGMLRNSTDRAQRPTWFDAYATRPVALVTSSARAMAQVERFVPNLNDRKELVFLVKSLSLSDDLSQQDPSDEFKNWLEKVYESVNETAP